LTKGKPIVPKLVRGEAAADILIKPSGPTPLAGIQRNVTLMDSYSKAAMVEAIGSKIADQGREKLHANSAPCSFVVAQGYL